MSKGYWMARLDVTDAEKYDAYRTSNSPAWIKYGARYLVRNGTFENPLGKTRSRHVILEFPSYQAALDCWASEEYQSARAKGIGGSEIDLVIVEGYDGPQPG